MFTQRIFRFTPETLRQVRCTFRDIWYLFQFLCLSCGFNRHIGAAVPILPLKSRSNLLFLLIRSLYWPTTTPYNWRTYYSISGFLLGGKPHSLSIFIVIEQSQIDQLIKYLWQPNPLLGIAIWKKIFRSLRKYCCNLSNSHTDISIDISKMEETERKKQALISLKMVLFLFIYFFDLHGRLRDELACWTILTKAGRQSFFRQLGVGGGAVLWRAQSRDPFCANN